MTQTRKTTFFLKLALCITLALSMFGAVLGFVGSSDLTAKADTVEYQDLLAIENRSWGAAADEYYFGGYTIGADTTNNVHWLNTDDSINGCWNVTWDPTYAPAYIENNGGVDIMEYIYVNGEQARAACVQNGIDNKYAGAYGGWIGNGGVCAPVYVETTNGSGLLIKILKAYAGDNFTLTFKAGFRLLLNDGNVLYVSDDVVYNCVGNVPTRVDKNTVTFNNESSVAVATKRVVSGQAIGELPAVPAKDGYGGFWTIDGTAINENTIISANKTATPVYGVEYEDLLGIEDRTAWGANDDEYYFGGVTLEPFGYFNSASSVNGCWNVTWDANYAAKFIANNNGVDIMEYIYVNGEQARAACVQNGIDNKYAGAYGGWIGNGGVCAPVYVETTNGSGLLIKILRAYAGDNFTLTFKAGFSLIRNDSEVIYLSSDVTYNCSSYVLSEGEYAGKTAVALNKEQQYNLTFDSVETRRVTAGATIGELPAVPAKDGYEGYWAIDGVKITADTVYNYGADKTAVAGYSKDVSDTVTIEFSSHNSVQSQFKIFINPANALCSNSAWNIQDWSTTLIAYNNGVDIMNYIYVNGNNARALSDDNRVNDTYPLGDGTGWLGNSAQCRPVFVESNSEGIWVTVLHSFSSENYKVTLKAGFSILDANGGITVINKDVSFNCSSGGGVSKVTGYTLTFEDVSSRQIEGGSTIGELPEVPAKDGYTGVWTIDGVEITADTVYNYGADKTAVAVYTKDVTDTVRIEFAKHTSVQSNFKIFITPASTLCENGAWNIQSWGTTLTEKNNGVDIMEYIYINGQNIRELSDDNRTNNTYPVGEATGWLTNSDQCRPVFVETNAEGIWVTVLHSFSSEEYKVTLKAGFAILDANGGTSVISEDVEFICTTGGGVTKVEDYTLSFDGLGDTLTVTGGNTIGSLPSVPANGDYDGVWTIDGVEINANTVYNYGVDKTAVASYSKDISKFIALEDRAWGACEEGGEYYFGVLDMRAANKVVNGESETYYLNSTVTDCWYHGNDDVITANGGVDIMEYIYINDTSARALITANVNGSQLKNDCNGDGTYGKGDCWLSNPAASPVYVETTNGSGIMIKVLTAYVGNFFEITLKSGFSLINSAGIRVYLTEDVTYKYIVLNGTGTLSKGEITDEDLDALNGQTVTLKNNGEDYLVKTTARIVLPAVPNVIVDEGISQVFVGWTTDANNITSSNLYPAGYVWTPDSAVTLHAVWIDFEMQDGASVRLATDSSGIKFKIFVDKGGYDAGVSLSLIKGVGAILCPTSYLDGRVLTHSLGTAGKHYAEVVVNTSNEAQFLYLEDSSAYVYSAAFSNIQPKDYARKYSARGYLKVQFANGEGYVYTNYDEELNSRSIYQVATSAYKDENNPQFKTHATILKYVNSVLDVTWDENHNIKRSENACGSYVISNITLSGATASMQADGVSSVVINGERLTASTNVNVVIGDLIYNFSELSIDGDLISFNIGAGTFDATKESDETLKFVSSKADLDFFLNDFFKRHTGVVEDGERLNVNSAIAGAGNEEFFNQEWISMSYYWFNGTDGAFVNEAGIAEDRIAGLNERLTTVPIDDYGYVWSSNDRVRDPYSEISSGEQRMGWPFPNNDTVSTAHWEFNDSGSDSGSWSSNVSASKNNGLFGATLNNQSSNITFTSNTFSSWTSKKIYTYYAPLLEFEVRIEDVTNVDDIVVWYTTSSSTSFSDDKKISVKERAFLSYDISNATGAYDHILYLPMYAQTAWGESTSVYVKQLKIEIVLKSGTTLSGAVALNYVRPTLDTRMSNNNSIYISSLRTAYDYTGDIDFLVENITRARKAYNFLMQMYDSTRQLKKESYLVGHGGTKESLSGTSLFGYSATNKSIASSISQGYWDIMYMPEYDFQSNVYFQKALVDMAYLEQTLTDAGKTVTKSLANVKTATRGGGYSTCAYTKYGTNANKIKTYASNNLGAIQATKEDTNHTGFWDDEKGRFVAGYASGEGKWYDYGYVAWNLEAIYYGIATDYQAGEIMTWLESEDALYDFVFAPRSNTVEGTDMLNGEYSAKKGKWDFGDNCQYGGAILYTSFYDIMARIQTRGADNAFERLQAIQKWYKEVYDYYVANGSDPYDFYRYYYDNKGIQCQGVGTNGAVGLDREFLESTLPLASVAYGFFGIDSLDGKTLQVAPEKPSELDFWKMENLLFNDVKYDLKITGNSVQITDVRGSVSGLGLQIVLKYTDGQSVYVNGVKLSSDGYTVENGKVTVNVDFGATVVEVR